MKVLWLVSWYPNRLDKFTGDFIQRHAQAVSKFCNVEVIYVKKDPSLAANTVDVQRNSTGKLTELIIYYNSKKFFLNVFSRFNSFLNYKKHYRKAVNTYFKTQGKPDYVHVHVAMNAGVAALWIKKKWNIPYFVTEHWGGYKRQSVPTIYNYNLFFRRLNTQILKEAALFFPVTEDLGQTIKSDFVDLQYHVIPNVVATEFFKYKPFTPPKFRFIHISCMDLQKNPEGIFIAAKELKSRGYNFELFMLGNKNHSLTILAEKYNLGQGDIFFEDAVPYVQVAFHMQQASALVLFSKSENLPCVMIEALCCGLPVISSNVGGISEVISSKNGILVESENTEALVDAMQNMMKDYAGYDKEKIAADATAKFNYIKIGGKIASFYK